MARTVLANTYPQLLLDGELGFTYTRGMSSRDLIGAIREELDKLNLRIDHKIIRGRNYLKEAKRHKFLLAQLVHLERVARVSQVSWGKRMATMASAFMF